MLLSVLAFAAAATAPTLPTVTVTKTAAGHSASAPEFPGSMLEAIEAEVRYRATTICALDPVVWGEFQYESEMGKEITAVPIKVRGYRRDFRCGAPTPLKGQRAADGWQPSPVDEADVRRFFSTYYGHRDRGEIAAARALFDRDTPSKLMADDLARTNSTIGKGNRRIVAVTWYVNPAQADRQGVFAAIDFVGDYPALHFYCGYLGLYRNGPGSYGIVREEQNMFAKAEPLGDPTHVNQFRAAMCRGN